MVATGARPGDAKTKRELFSEETQTVLVMEDGAVIRLSAAVTDGQLIFLHNKKTGKEVVTQVMRKRSFRPTSCYVDLAFTEPCPDFWGSSFAALAAGADSAEAPGIAEPEESEPSASPAAVSAKSEEVENLKREVAELQSKLNSLMAAPAESGEEAEVPVDPADAAVATGQASGSRRTHARPQSDAAKVGIPTRGGASKTLLTIAGMALLVSAGVIAFYSFGGYEAWSARWFKPAGAGAPPAGNAPPPAAKPAASAAEKSANAGDAKPADVPKSSDEKSDAATKSTATGKEIETRAAKAGAHNAETPAASLSAPMRVGDAGAQREDEDASKSNQASSSLPNDDATQPPKLIKSVRPAPPAEALVNHVSGNVKMDALVDATGHVKSVTVISGRDELRPAAIAGLKQYVYEPARKNGKPVAAHVEVTMQFWYEP